ncbi:MAG: hypothetical protein HDS86_03675 [Bacteroidales bacterium]|nr:hypothetical protein [Bacteroidales bacterium]
MNAKTGKWISNVLMLAVGITLCVMWKRQDILYNIIYLIGGLFVLTGLINLLVSSRRRRKNMAGTGSTFVGTTSGIGGICIGAALLLAPAFFVGIIVYALAIFLILAGVWQFYILGYGFAPIKFPGWFYIFPIVLIVEGVVILCAGGVRESADVVVLMTGIGIILYAINSFFELGSAGMQKGRIPTATVEPSVGELTDGED